MESLIKVKETRRLGREVKVSPKAITFVCESGTTVSLPDGGLAVPVGIVSGEKKLEAYLLMSTEAYELLNAGGDVSVLTKKNFFKGAK